MIIVLASGLLSTAARDAQDRGPIRPIDHDAIDGFYQLVWRLERDIMARIYRFDANFWEVARYPGIVLGLIPIGSFPTDEGDRTGDLPKRVP